MILGCSVADRNPLLPQIKGTADSQFSRRSPFLDATKAQLVKLSSAEEILCSTQPKHSQSNSSSAGEILGARQRRKPCNSSDELFVRKLIFEKGILSQAYSPLACSSRQHYTNTYALIFTPISNINEEM